MERLYERRNMLENRNELNMVSLKRKRCSELPYMVYTHHHIHPIPTPRSHARPCERFHSSWCMSFIDLLYREKQCSIQHIKRKTYVRYVCIVVCISRMNAVGHSLKEKKKDLVILVHYHPYSFPPRSLGTALPVAVGVDCGVSCALATPWTVSSHNDRMILYFS